MGKIRITREHAVSDYLALKKELGRQPTSSEYAERCHSVTILRSRFGDQGWKKLVEAAGDRPLRANEAAEFTREHLVNDYLSLKTELGRTPRLREFAKAHHSGNTLDRAFDKPGWRRLVLAAGDKPIRHDYKEITRRRLIADYAALIKKLGRRPTAREYTRDHHSHYVLSKYFGRPGWKNMVKAAGGRVPARQELTAEHLIKDFIELQSALGRRPKLTEFQERHHTNKVLVRVFGGRGWRSMISALGGRALPGRPLTAEHLVEDFLDLKQELGRRPTQEEFQRKRHTGKVLTRVFGKKAWSKLIEAAEKRVPDK